MNRFMPDIKRITAERERMRSNPRYEPRVDAMIAATQEPSIEDIPALCAEVADMMRAIGLPPRKLRASDRAIDGISVFIPVTDPATQGRHVWLDFNRRTLVWGRPFPDAGKEIPDDVLASSPTLPTRARNGVVRELIFMEIRGCD